MSPKEPEELPRYRPVSDTGNGHRVRPDLQTKLIGAFVLFVFLGALGWVGTTTASLAARTTRIETLLEVWGKTLDKIDQRLERLENKGK